MLGRQQCMQSHRWQRQLCFGPNAANFGPWACLLLVPLLVLLRGAGAIADCTLDALDLRYEDSTIDLDPPFASYIDSYSVRLDWAFESFSVFARPDTGCEVQGVPDRPLAVPIGGSTELTLYVMHPDIGAKHQYVIKAFRQLGSETDLQSLDVEGGELSPVFSQRHREYEVTLGLSHDVVRVVYGLADDQQRITSSAQEERPSAKERGGSAGGDGALGGNGGRRLEAVIGSGEMQFRTAHVDYMLDVGFSRTIELTVQCADPTQASIGTYTLHVSRPGCTPERPFFDPQKKACVNFCSSGFYRNMDIQRCSRCNDHCKICSGLLECHMCLPDTQDFSYAIEPDGKCRAIANHIFRKYRWWCAGLGILLLFLVMIGCCGIVQYCCSASVHKSGRFARLNDTDTDEEEFSRNGGGRRFARY